MKHSRRSTRCKYRSPKEKKKSLTLHSIARYTEDYTHLDRCTPSLPDPSQTEVSVTEIYRNLESPRHYYATVADSIPDPRTARVPSTQSMQNMHPLERQPSPIQRRASLVAMQQPGSSDQHISASEPRVFPGLVHQRHRRTSERRKSHGTDDGHGTGSEMSSSFHLEPVTTRMRVKEDDPIVEVKDQESE